MSSPEALRKEFLEYVEKGNNMPPQTADNMLIAYAFFKQATVGDNTHDRPVHSDVVRTFKHDAWKRLEGMSREEAMRGYINHIKKLLKQTETEES